MAEGAVVVVGGTSGMGRDVVISGRDAQRARAIATEVGGRTVGIGLELDEPETIATRLRSAGPVEHLVIAAIDRDENTARDYDVNRAIRLTTLKLVGYTEVIHALLDRMGESTSLSVVS